MINRTTFLVLSAATALFSGCVVLAQGVPPPPSSTQTPPVKESVTPIPGTHMAEALRAAINKVVVVPGESPAERAVSGSYAKGAAGLYGGMVAGSRTSTVSKDVGPVTVNVPIPILQLPGMIIGGIAGTTQKEIQDFRDALTDDLRKASSKPLSNEKIALDVYSDIRKLPNLDSSLFAPTTPIPEDTDAIVFVAMEEIGIDVQGREAIITTTAKATVTRANEETDVYSKVVSYQDRDTLSNWTDNDNAVWRDYTNFARHYIGRELSAEVFHTVTLKHTLQPSKTDTVRLINKNIWQASSKKLSPTLAWELDLLSSDDDPSWASGLDEANIFYDVEIYDLHKPVYSQQQILGSRHTVATQLDACKEYRWSVRPSYHVGSDIRYGKWMRSNVNADSTAGDGNVGRKASVAPAFLQDFASLEIKCGSK